MSFEEEFPSLQSTNWFEMIDNKELDNIIHSIQDNCLDKQRVKEAINSIYLDVVHQLPDNNFTIIKNLLLKELGLND